ncbi:MAG: hypothetical protein ABIN94_13485 [Ferruginibacter sp.]
MQDEEMDNMDEFIREASESHHPVYDDKAWDIMEAMLDIHLPQKKERKRPVILYTILLLLIITAGALFIALYPSSKKDKVFTKSLSSKSNNKSSDIPDSGHLANLTSTSNVDVAGPVLSKGQQGRQIVKGTIFNTFSSKKVRPNPTQLNKTANLNGRNDYSDSKETITNTPSIIMDGNGHVALQATAPAFVPTGIKQNEPSKTPYVQIVSSDSTAKKSVSRNIKNFPSPPPKPFGKMQQNKKGFTNKLAITISAGPDMSFVTPDHPGKTRLSYGAGLSYWISNRFMLRGGFYTSQKIYTASPEDYHPPKGYWTYLTDLKKIDADCKVYEIPLAASYNFKPSKNHQWFAAVGLSSFIMKTETYNYLYKDAMGRTMYKTWKLQNQNKHFFSILTMSAGYEHQINNAISLIAEPYFKLPLSGIGFGKIKLNSGGLLLTASIRPFAKVK